MTVVSSKQFATNQKKFYNLALNEDIAIKRGRKIFYLTYSNNVVDDDASDLALAMERRRNSEFVSGEEFSNYMKQVINEKRSSQKGI